MPAEDRVIVNVLIGSLPPAHGDARQDWLTKQIASAPDGDLLVLPFMAQYSPFWRVIDRAAGFAHGERAPYPSIGAIAAVVQDRGIRTLATVLAVVAEGVFYATAVTIEPDGRVDHLYRQEHAVNEPEWHERLYFQPGLNSAPPVIDVGGFSLGLLLGGDLWVPEAARMLRLAGAETLLSVSGAPEALLGSVRAIVQARAIENGVPVIWSTGGGGGRKDPGEGATERADHLPWHQVMLHPEEIRAALGREDPLRTRRPRLYRSLTKTWDESAE